MLQIHFANRFETLQALLLQALAGPARDPFAALQLIVPSTAVRRVLTQAIADAHGVCANVHFDYLASWLWQRSATPSGAPSNGPSHGMAMPQLVWAVYAALADVNWVAAHPRLVAYLAQADEVMRFELARRVASLFEQYITYRPDWLQRWADGSRAESAGHAALHVDEAWQAALWTRMLETLAATGAGAPSLVPGLSSPLMTPSSSAVTGAAGVPAQTVHVFALPTMPPLHLASLQQLGAVLDVKLYVLNPCREHWFDLVDSRRLSQLTARRQSQGFEEGHPLLSAWGRQTQSHIDALVEASGPAAVLDEHFVPHPEHSLLADLQNSILDLQTLAPGSIALDTNDRSMEVHVCHSLTRELEVLHDRLLGLFAESADAGHAAPLHPSQVLVVVPDLDAAAPLIDAVFGTVPPHQRIAYTVTGRARSRVDEPARALLALLSLAASRMPISEVFSLLQQPLVARRFGLDEAAQQQLWVWAGESGMHWGLDASHRGLFDLPAEGRHTLADGLERLFLGYALPSARPLALHESLHSQPFDGRLPSGHAEGSQAAVLGLFWRFVSALRDLQSHTSQPHTPDAWTELLLQLLQGLIEADEDTQEDLLALQASVRELGRRMQQGGVQQPLSLAVVRAALEQQLDDPARGGVPSGGITFSSMSSLRSLPFEVVCVLGLNDGAFPTVTRPPEFDLLAANPRRGDRQRRVDERNLFLDLLLAARRVLHLSHTGRSVRDNAALPPSVLVAELLDLLVPVIASDPASAAALATARRRLVVEHPLQPFSPSAFRVDADPRVRSHNADLAQALNSAAALQHQRALARASVLSEHASQADDALQTDDMAAHDFSAESNGEAQAGEGADPDRATSTAFDIQPLFFTHALPAPGPEWRAVSLQQLVDFLGNPSRHLLRQRLGIELRRSPDELEDDEPFLADGLARRALAQRLLPALLQGAPVDSLPALALAGTDWPSGALGATDLLRELNTLARFARPLRSALAPAVLAPHAVELPFTLDGEPWRLNAEFTDLRPDGLLRWRHGSTRARDLLAAWVQHLVLCLAPAPGATLRTRWLASDGDQHFTPVAAPGPLLQDLLQLYRSGLQQPLHFFAQSAWAFVERGDKLSAAAAAWQVTPHARWAEGGDDFHRLALRGLAQPLDADFVALAHRVFDPLREHLVNDGI